MDNRTLTINVKLNEHDVYDFQKSNLFKWKYIAPVVFFCLICILIVVVIFSNRAALTLEGINPMVFWPFIIVLLFFSSPFFLKRSVKKNFETNKLIQREQCYMFDEEGIRMNSEAFNARVKWEELYKAVETKKILLFFTAENQAYVIPKRLIGRDAKQIELLRKYMMKAPIPPKEKTTFWNIFIIIMILSILNVFSQNMR